MLAATYEDKILRTANRVDIWDGRNESAHSHAFQAVALHHQHAKCMASLWTADLTAALKLSRPSSCSAVERTTRTPVPSLNVICTAFRAASNTVDSNSNVE
jgi:hypothetical protein